jgi:hypothetical protein
MAAVKSLDAPEFMTFYLLVNQSSSQLYFSLTSGTSTTTHGTGFFSTRDEAEKARTVAILADKTDAKFHIFELDFPNPAYRTA